MFNGINVEVYLVGVEALFGGVCVSRVCILVRKILVDVKPVRGMAMSVRDFVGWVLCRMGL